MAEQENPRISIYLPRALLLKIKKIALDKDITSTEWIRDTLIAALKKPAKAV